MDTTKLLFIIFSVCVTKFTVATPVDPATLKLGYRVRQASLILDATASSVRLNETLTLFGRTSRQPQTFPNFKKITLSPNKLIIPNVIGLPLIFSQFPNESAFITPITQGDRAIWLFYQWPSATGLGNPYKYPVETSSSGSRSVWGIFWSRGRTFWTDNPNCSEARFLANLRTQRWLTPQDITSYQQMARRTADSGRQHPYPFAIALIASCLPTD